MAKKHTKTQKPAKSNKKAKSQTPVSTAKTSALETEKNSLTEPSYTDTWNLDTAWVTGLTGAVMTLLCAYWFAAGQVLQRGVSLFGNTITNERTSSILVALVIIGVSMIAAEFLRKWKRDGKFFSITKDPLLRAGNQFRFAERCLVIFIQNMILLWLICHFYETASEYGFRNNSPFYQPWFFLLDKIWTCYLILGLPYIALTRAYLHDSEADKTDSSQVVSSVGMLLISYIPGLKSYRPEMGRNVATAFQKVVILMFFLPLMTVFFVDQFPHLINNLNYIGDGMPNSLGNTSASASAFNIDLTNIIVNVLITLHMALAWCAFIITNRWINNSNRQPNPRLGGWLVCFLCYPPMVHLLITKFFKSAAPGPLFTGAHEALFHASWQGGLTVLIILMGALYAMNLATTIFMGLSFAELSNKGIVRKGPFAYVRHPAYASKMLGWSCVGLPFIIFSALQGDFKTAGIFIVSVVVTYILYIVRALTEETHLSDDPQYALYKKNVPYRFIPKVI